MYSSTFSAASLFYNGEVGQLMPVDPAYLYQDTAGTTPVTATGQSVALQLDQSKGLVLGPELVTNGTFPSAITGWTVGSAISASVVSGEAQITFAGSAALTTNNWFSQLGVLSSTIALYKVTFDATTVSGGVLVVSGGYDVQATISVNGGTKTSYSLFLKRGTAGTATDQQSLVFSGASGAVWKIDNISVRELPGNHDTQPTVGSRPIYGKHPANGYRNMLADSENFSSSGWVNLFGVVTRTSTTGPNGATGAWTLTTNTTDGGLYKSAGYGGGNVGTCRITAKAGTSSVIRIQDTVSGNGAHVDFNLLDGTAGTAVTDGTGGVTISGIYILSLGAGWYRLGYTALRTAVGSNFIIVAVGASGSTIDVFQPQCELGSTATTYQRTGASSGVAWPAPPSYDITEAGQPDLHYLHYNGVSSFMVSPTITPGIDKAQVFVGVRKLSDAANGNLVELSGNTNISAGSFYLWAPEPSLEYSSLARGNAAAAVSQRAEFDNSSAAAPVTSVIAATHDIAGDLSTIRHNGVTGTNATGDKGTGNFLAYPIYTGRRGGASVPFNGLVYSKIVRFGANLTADQIASTERWTAQRTGVSL